MYKCKECGLIYPRPRLTPEETRAIYKNFYTNCESFSFEEYNNSRTYDHNSGEFMFRRIKLDDNPLYKLLNRLGMKPGAKALDIGAFSGWFCLILADRGFAVQGIEPQKHAAEFARSKGLEVYDGLFPDAIPQSILGQSYDLVSVLECSYYMFDLRRGLDTIRNLLCKGGKLILKNHQGHSKCYANGSSLFSRYGDFIQGIPTWDSMKYCLHHSGFRIREIFPYPDDYVKNYYGVHYPPVFSKPAGVLNRMLLKRFVDPAVAHNIVAVAEKVE